MANHDSALSDLSAGTGAGEMLWDAWNDWAVTVGEVGSIGLFY